MSGHTRSPLQKVGKWVYDFMLLVIPVMLGVYLGLLADNWNNQQIEARQTQKIKENLIREFDYNVEISKVSADYFTMLRDSIFFLTSKTISPSTFSFWKGLNTPLFKTASFTSASLSGVLTNFEFDLIEGLSTSYDLIYDLEKQSATYVNSITNKIGMIEFNNENYLIILENYAHDQIAALDLLTEQLLQTREKLQASMQ